MKVRILILSLIFPALFFSQEQQSGGVELPEFVITGSQQVSLPVMKKRRPPVIPVLDQEFFLPAYAPDNLTLRKFNYSLIEIEPAKKKSKYFGGVLQLGGGLHTYPEGIFTIDKNVKHVLLHGALWGFNINDYVKYSNYNESGGEAGLTFYLSKKSPFMPGMKIGTFVRGMRNSFYWYGTRTPSLKRETNSGSAVVSLQYGIKRYFNYKINFAAKLFGLTEKGIKNYNLFSDGYFQYRFANAGLRFDYKYLVNEFGTSSAKLKRSDFMYGKVFLLLSPFRSFKAKLGFSFSKADTNYQFVPTASFQLMLDKGIYFFGEYLPFADYKTFPDFFAQNRYLNISDLEGKFIDYYSSIKLAFKFEYEKLFETSAGLEFQSARDLPYFEDSAVKGKFEIETVRQANFRGAFFEATVFPGRFGSFYFKTKINDVRNEKNNLIPYYPLLKIESVYSYFFPYGLTASVDFKYFYDYYTNISNSNKIKDYLNLSLNLNFKLWKYLEIFTRVENILNWKNYFYKGYREKTNDFIGGIRYRF